MNNINFSKIRFHKDLQRKNHYLKRKLSEIRKTLKDIEEVEQQKMTTQYALFSVDSKGRYHFQRIIDTMDESTEEYPDEELAESALVIPLPDHTTLKEFDGF